MKRQNAGATAIAIVSLFGMFFIHDAMGWQQAPAPAPAPSPQPQQASPEESPNDLFVTVGKSVVVESAQTIERVSVGFGDVAEANAVSPKEILVNGKAPGETSLIVWQEGGGKLFFDVIVQPSRFGSRSRAETLSREIRTEFFFARSF